MNKETLKILIKEIGARVDIAAHGQTSTEWWSYPEDNLSAPEGMDYWDWIYDAERKALKAVDEFYQIKPVAKSNES